MNKIKINQEDKLDFNSNRDEFGKTLYKNTVTHVNNIKKVINELMTVMKDNVNEHDKSKYNNSGTKSSEDFIDFAMNKFDGDWFEYEHIRREKHHFHDYVHKDITLLDIIEGLVDGICAGRGRGNQEPYNKEISNETLQLAFKNTFKMICDMTEVDKGETKDDN